MADFVGACTCEVPGWNSAFPGFGLVYHGPARRRHRRTGATWRLPAAL